MVSEAERGAEGNSVSGELGGLEELWGLGVRGTGKGWDLG